MLRKAVRFAAAAGLAVTTALWGAAPAHAADSVIIRKVDTTAYPKVSLTVLKPPVSTSNADVQVSENGKQVTGATVRSTSDAGLPMGVVLVLDSSEVTDGGQLDQVKAAVRTMVQSKVAGEQFAIVATNGTARTVVPFTADASLLLSGLDRIQPSGQNTLWSGVQLAAGLISQNRALQGNVVVVDASNDALSPNGTLSNANNELKSSNAAVLTVALDDGHGPEVGNLQALAGANAGRSVEVSNAADIDRVLQGFQANLASQAIVEYTSTSNAKALDISVGVGTGVATAKVAVGTVSEGAAVAPQAVEADRTPWIFRGNLGLLVVALLAFGCVGLLLYGLIEIVGNERNQLSRALRPYSQDEDDEQRDISKLADSEIIRKAVAATAKAAHDRGLLQVVQKRMEQADLPLRPAEALFFTGLGAIVAMVIGLVLFGILGLALAGLLFAYLPIAVTGFMANRRRKKFTGQLPDTLQLLAGSLRAGYSLVQGLDAVSKQCEAPMGTELQRAMAEARLGRPVEDALQEVSDRMGSDDFEWAIMAIKIQREVGGNLAELLMTVGETMIARERLRREVRALTAEGRVSAAVLVCLPPGIGAIISILNPTYMSPLWHNTLGQYALIGAGLMMGFGYWLMRKMIQVEA